MDLALEAGVRYTPGPRLWFDYERYDGTVARRYIEPYREITGTGNARYWETGAKAKGAVWFPASPHQSQPRTVLLCEGETDALAAVQSGCPYLVACVPGAAMHDTELPRFFDNICDEIVCAFDNDDAGNKGAQLIREHCAQSDLDLSRFLPPSGSDLKDVLKGDQPRVLTADWHSLSQQFGEIPVVSVVRPAPLSMTLPTFRRPIHNDKPDLLAVWQQVARPLPKRPPRHDAKGRAIHEAYCPLHDDGKKPGAWVGEDRWGCWVCGIESADVYELVAWTRGVVAPHTKLRGQDFARAKEIARTIAGDL